MRKWLYMNNSVQEDSVLYCAAEKAHGVPEQPAAVTHTSQQDFTE